ncbi:MAG TPA: glycosylasparaginase [Acidobacteria bacterium]|nr:glycosylasparaginase [Acidobacteriota bacterium]
MSIESRREFLRKTMIGAGAVSLASLAGSGCGGDPPAEARRPLVVSTWRHGLAANEVAWELLEAGGRALDAVEAGVRVSEADPEVRSVGLGGAPDGEGHVTLDACIMDQRGECGAVAFLEHILHPISVARMVMEKTPHVMLVGSGALDFALANGFEKTNLLTAEAEAKWRQWLLETSGREKTGAANHDTIGMLAIDEQGDLSGACTTSGLAYKLRGRVGDSPIIGAGLYVDNAVGAACATGRGELVMKTLGTFLIVELMRHGASPDEACRRAIGRIDERGWNDGDAQVGYLAIDKSGRVGASSLRPGFQYAVRDGSGDNLLDAQPA